jgi:DNA repair protein RecO (recombination protein O)
VAPLSTDAIVLSALRYGDTSKIVRLATRQFGVVSAIAKGALRPKSRFGASLQVLSRGQAQLLPARASDLHQLTGFDLLHLPVGLGAAMGRYTGALALAEIVQRFAPSDPHPEVYDALWAGLDQLETAAPAQAGTVALRSLWRLVALLGFEPSLETCVLDDREVPPGAALPFSVREGGALCETCARTHAVRRLPTADRSVLVNLLHGTGAPSPLEARHEAAHRRLVAQFIQYQLADGVDLPALDVWQRQAWEQGP